MLWDILIGGILAILGVIVIARLYPKKDHAFWRMGLLIAAIIYVIFALWGKAWTFLPLELIGVAIYGLFAFLSKKYTLYWLAFGWLLHIAWDVALHMGEKASFVPDWYPGWCIGFDLVIAAYIVFLVASKKQAYKDLLSKVANDKISNKQHLQ